MEKKNINFKGTIHKKFWKKLHKDQHSKAKLDALYGPLILRTPPAPMHWTVANVFKVTVHLKSYGPGQKLGCKLQSV
jgi:hypothetical protein